MSVAIAFILHIDWSNCPFNFKVGFAIIEANNLSGPISKHLDHFFNQRALSKHKMYCSILSHTHTIYSMERRSSRSKTDCSPIVR